MTQHDEVFPYGEAVRLAEKHQGDIASRYTGAIYSFTSEQLAALIAEVSRNVEREVRRQAMEECITRIGAFINHDPDECDACDILRELEEAIRARLSASGKLDSLEGKEEGK